MITIDASSAVGGTVERYPILKDQTLLELLVSRNYVPGHVNEKLFDCYVNKKPIPIRDFDKIRIGPEDNVHMILVPRGDPITIGLIVGAVIGLAASFLYRPSVTGAANQRTGERIELASIDVNQPRLGQVVPDNAGRCVIWPDVIVPARTYFVADPNDASRTVQWYEVGLCIGVGEYEKPIEQVKIGDTPFLSFGDYASVQFNEPGASVVGQTPFEWWHTNKEVGATRTGGSGLELQETYDVTPFARIDLLELRGTSLSIPTGQGAFPEDWVPGLLIKLQQAIQVTFSRHTSNGSPTYARVSGAFENFNPGPGMTLEIIGVNGGTYVVEEYAPAVGSEQPYITLNYTSGSPAIYLEEGTYPVSLGVPGQVYSIVSVTPNSMVVSQPRTGTTEAWNGFNNEDRSNVYLPLDTSTLEADWVGPIVACPEGKLGTKAEIDLHWPNGLVGFNNNGDPLSIYIAVEIQWREALSNNPWESYIVEYQEAKVDAFGVTVTIDTGLMRPEFRLRIAGYDEFDRRNVRRDVNWYQLKLKMQEQPSSYADVTTLGIRLAGDKRTSSNTDNQVSCVATRILPNLVDNEISTPAVTTSPVDYALYVLKSVGYDDRYFGLEAWQSLRDKALLRGDSYNMRNKDAATVKEIVSQALHVVFADITYLNNKLVPVRDERRTGIPDHGFSSQNMLEDMAITMTPPNPDDMDGVDVTYRDATTWAERTVRCRLPGDLGNRTKKIVAYGITDRDKAYRYGMRHYLEEVYRRVTFNLTTGLDARNIGWMSYIGIANDVPGYTQTGKVLGYDYLTGDQVRVYTNQTFDWNQDGTFVVCFRRPDGTLTPAVNVERGDDDFTLICEEPDFTFLTGRDDRDPTDVYFGLSTRFLYRALVDKVTVQGSYTDENEPQMTIEAVRYVDQLYDYDDADAPEDA